MHYNIAFETEKYFYFYLKKLSTAEMRRGYTNPSKTKNIFDFLSPMNMSRITVMYTRF